MEPMKDEEERRDRFRKRCQPRPLDLCTLGDGVQFFQFTIVDESKGGLGCTSKGADLPQVGSTLDWCGLKRYEVRWVEKKKEGVNKLGLQLCS
jgi:hypothetical protein